MNYTKRLPTGLLAASLFLASGLFQHAGAQSLSEGWNSLSIAQSNLRAEKPLLGERDDLPDFTRELIEVRWRPNDPIYLYVILPKHVIKPAVILYLYNYSFDTQQFLNEEFCKILTKDGVAAVGFASALSGQRYHDRPMKQWFVSELQESLTITVQDIQMILNYLASRKDLDMTQVGMFGDGSGGAIAVLAAVTDTRIRAIDLLDPWGDWPDWVAKSRVVPDNEREEFLTPAFLAKVAPFDPIRWLPRLKIPVRIEYLRSDGATPPVAIERMKASAPAQTLIVPTESGLAEYRATSGSTFLNWIKGQIRKPQGS
ncbi:MAG: alpha/beta hydrolase [Acidobacteriaceae bacterium]|nr:alpha/beta hydrolase [Acidobacteriaceae bacterium]